MAKWVIIVDDKSVEMMDMLDRSCWHQLELSIDFRIGKNPALCDIENDNMLIFGSTPGRESVFVILNVVEGKTVVLPKPGEFFF